MKIYHEAPKSIFKEVQEITGGDYALVHLFDEDQEYYNIFKEAVASGREVILDNSIFELGEAFDMSKFAEKVIDLKPAWYIVPDCLEGMEVTIENMKRWDKEFLHKMPEGCKRIGVVQGKTYEEIVQCYKFMLEEKVDKIAISFDMSLYEEMIPDGSNKYEKWMLGRVAMLDRMVKEGIIDINVPHHLLGVALPQEGKFYVEKNYKFIDSMDTSNPVIHGLNGIEYSDEGLQDKVSTKLYSLINTEVSENQLNTILNNILMFRSFWTKKHYSRMEYINAQRVIDLMVSGPIEGIYNTVDLKKEYDLILEKKSRLSRGTRDRIKSIVNHANTKYVEDLENGTLDRWNNIQSLIDISQKLLNRLKGK